MAHFAQIDNNNIVLQVIIVNNYSILSTSFTIVGGNIVRGETKEIEEKGIAICRNLFGQNTNWVQTSYNSTFRKNFAGIGYVWDPVKDAFIPPRPYISWSLNETNCKWEAPISYPNDGKLYRWDENTLTWIEIA
jgi:hypothetical protein